MSDHQADNVRRSNVESASDSISPSFAPVGPDEDRYGGRANTPFKLLILASIRLIADLKDSA
jgi:hypothetical protein